MYLHRHETATCPHCRSAIAYGTKEEPSNWKVVVQCDPRAGCGRELGIERIPVASVDHHDNVAEQAEAIAARFGD